MNTQENEVMEVIDVYSRAQAIEDGVLVDISHTAEVKECGFKLPVCVTSHLWKKINMVSNGSQDWHGRLWDVCSLAMLAFRKKFLRKEDFYFCVFEVSFFEDQDPVTLWLCFNEAEGFTIMFPEDEVREEQSMKEKIFVVSIIAISIGYMASLIFFGLFPVNQIERRTIVFKNKQRSIDICNAFGYNTFR